MSMRRASVIFIGALLIVTVAVMASFFFEGEERVEREKRGQSIQVKKTRRLVKITDGPLLAETEIKEPERGRSKKISLAKSRREALYRITGRVVDSRGKAVANAEVIFFEGEEMNHSSLRLPISEEKIPTKTVRSKADGTFLCEEKSEPKWSYIRIKSMFKRVYTSQILLIDHESRRLDLGDIELADAVVIRGQVLDPVGAAISGAQIDFERVGGTQSLASFQAKYSHVLEMDTLMDAVVVTSEEEKSVLSDEQGRFVISNLEPGKYELFAGVSAYRPSAVTTVNLYEEQSAEVTLNLRALSTLHISVKDPEGQPVLDPRITISEFPDNGLIPYPPPKKTGLGRFTYKDLAWNLGQISISKAGYTTLSTRVKLSEESVIEQSYILKPWVEIYGSVLSQSTHSKLKGIVSIFERSTKFGEGRETETRLDSQGGFRTRELGPGAYKLMVVVKEHGVIYRDIDIPEGVRSFKIEPIHLEPLETVEVLVLDPEGKGLKDLRVRVTDYGFSELPLVSGGLIIASAGTQRTDESGRVLLGNVARGTIGFCAEHPHFPTAYADSVLVSGSGAKVTLRFSKQGGELRGDSFDSEGRKKKRGNLALVRRGFRRPEQTAQIQSDGSFHMRNIAPGQYKLLSFKDDPNRVFESGGWFQVTAGATTRHDHHDRD